MKPQRNRYVNGISKNNGFVVKFFYDKWKSDIYHHVSLFVEHLNLLKTNLTRWEVPLFRRKLMLKKNPDKEEKGKFNVLLTALTGRRPCNTQFSL